MKAMENLTRNKDGLKLFVVLVAVLSVALGATIVLSQEGTATDSNDVFEDNCLEYRIINDNEVEVQNLTDRGLEQLEITIPDKVSNGSKDYLVTEIGDDAFKRSDARYTKVIIGDNVRVIGERAFCGHEQLIDVVFGKNVETIDMDAFYGTSITDISLGDRVKHIDNTAFMNCSSTTSLTIPASVNRIGIMAFFNCTSLEIINYNAINAEVDWTSFIEAGTKKLTVVFGDGVEMIASKLFQANNNLWKVSIGPNTSVGDCTFNNCENLRIVENRTVETDGNLSSSHNKPTSIGYDAYRNCYIEKLSLSPNTVSIGEGAFYGNDSLTVVVIPGSVTEIGNEAFGDCPNIDKFAFGDFDDTVKFGDHIFSYEDGTNGIVDYKFRNMDGKEYTFTDANVESGVFDNRAYDVDENGKAINVFGLLLDANGGTCEDVIAFTDENGVLMTPLPKPVRDGYTFAGWYDGNEKVGVGSIFAENTTLTAKWVVAQSTDITSVPLLILLLLAIIAVAGIAVMPRKE